MAVNGIDLIIPTSIAHTSGSASINAGGSVTFTGVTALSLNGVFSSTYDNYVIDMRHSASTTVNPRIRMRTAGTDNSTTNSYVFQRILANGTSVSGERVTGNNAFIGGATSTQRDGLDLFVYGPNLAQPTAMRSVTVYGFTAAAMFDCAVTHNQSVSYDGFSILNDGSGATFTGLIKVYGLVK
jgi:hypothetical protein